MKPLDLNTLLYVVGAISLLFAILMLHFYRLTPSIKGPLHWALGSFSAVAGSLLLVSASNISGYIAYVIGGVFTVLAISYYLAGIQVYKNQRINYPFFFGLVIAEFVLSSFFYLIVPNPQLRMASFSVVCMVGSLFVAREFMKPVPKTYHLAFILCSAVFLVSALTSLYRIISIFLLRPVEPTIPLLANLLFYFMASITQALLMFSFLLLISLKIAERLELKVQDQQKFYSIIAHDLSGPVGMINVMLNMVNQDHEMEKDKKAQIYGEVENLSNSTYHLLQNLLFWSRSRLETLKPNIGKFDLNKVILHNIDFSLQMAETKGISINYTPNSQLSCQADVRMIDTVLRNLISNAIKFSHQGGTIAIDCEKLESHVQIKIADKGIGMSEEVHKKLFISRENNSVTGTDGERGSGLGLMICKEFIEGNRGSLQIKSQVNEGTEVLVSLPIG